MQRIRSPRHRFPADGRVVHLGYGCGAHSETGKDDGDREIPRATGVVLDELDVEYQKQAQSPTAEAGEGAIGAAEAPTGEGPKGH